MSVANLAAAGILFTERREFDLDMDSDVKELYPSETPFLTDLYNRREEVDDPDFKMFEDASAWRYERFSLNEASPSAWPDSGNPGSTLADLPIDGLVGLQDDASLEGLVVEIWNSDKTTYKGVAYISSYSASTITIKAISNALATNQQMVALADNDVFEVVSHAAGEGSYSPEAIQSQPSVVWNSCAIQRTPIEITKTLAKTALKGTRLERQRAAKELERLRIHALRRHKMRVQKRILMEARVGGIGSSGEDFIAHITDKDGRIVRTTMGYIPAILRYGSSTASDPEQNIFDINTSTYTFTDLADDFDKIAQYKYGSEVTAYCGPKALTYWASLANAGTSSWQVQMNVKESKTYGTYVTQLTTGSLTVNLVPLHILRNTPYDGYMLIPDMDNISYKYFRNDMFNANIKNENGYDGIKDEYMSDMGLGLTQVKRHSILRVSS